MAPKFTELWNGYPTGTQQELFAALGGGWPSLVGVPAYENTCALRFSVAMMATGHAPPIDLASADGNLKTGDGRPLIIRVSTARTWLERALGPLSWGMSKAVGADIDRLIPPWTGILLYRVPGATDASGHVDLWNQTGCRRDCHAAFARAATEVELWRLA